jgi:hypothetical protein
MMELVSANKCMRRERYNQILNNLHGFDMSKRSILQIEASWSDQRNKLNKLHMLEKNVFERTIDFF